MLYDIAFLIFSIFYLPALIFKGKLHKDFPERFGIYHPGKFKLLKDGAPAIWIQAVSVGEVNLLKTFIPLLYSRYPGYRIVLSTVTKTGNDLAKKLFPDAAVIYFPLDFSPIVKHVIGIIRPSCYVMVETEIWPNVLKELSQRAVPSVMINGRISDRSFGKYKLVRRFLKPVLNKVSRFSMQSETDRDRIVELGAPRAHVEVIGNMKFDIMPKIGLALPEKIRSSIGLAKEELLLVGGSTHDGEEAALLAAYSELVKEFPGLRLIIAPRHVNRSGAVVELIKSHAFRPIRFSEIENSAHKSAGPGKSVMILDTIGHLADIYTISSIVFIGGSLVKHGGQNPLEPAIYAKPIIFGPYMFNFKEIARILISNDAARQVSDEKELCAAIRELLTFPETGVAMGNNAKMTVLDRRGATDRNIALVGSMITSSKQRE